ncbi:unnamed protein product [Darwinula stevensoni]|uniref:Cadherin domain-containing protein n=1 Tax=Darwinula stevensoni TaxID=69355 RepID=A0A7R8X3L5_9CRUS|nr:unnamed protein product [Darwinula stevensoni]CAG0884506.1 unnamed protein product [Darwinula stevensoni]
MSGIGLVILLGFFHAVRAQLCHVETGRSVIILDIRESRGNEVTQRTIPGDLPIRGTPGEEISLEILDPRSGQGGRGGGHYFVLYGKRLQLHMPLDRDPQDVTSLVFQVDVASVISCTVLSSGERRNIPVIVRVADINDNKPVFVGTPYSASVSEVTWNRERNARIFMRAKNLSPVGTTVFRDIKAKDLDAGVNGMVEYMVVKGEGKGGGQDGYGVFSINLPHQGHLTVNRSLDYESASTYYVTVVAMDRAKEPEERYTSTTTLTVHVEDSDDMEPTFKYRGCTQVGSACVNPEYQATVRLRRSVDRDTVVVTVAVHSFDPGVEKDQRKNQTVERQDGRSEVDCARFLDDSSVSVTSVKSGELSGVLNVKPEDIRAEDMDSLRTPIRYSFLRGSPGFFRDFFRIDPRTGHVTQLAAADRSRAKRFDLIVKVSRVPPSREALTIEVGEVDVHPPEIRATSSVGYVRENSPVGTVIMDSSLPDALRQPILFSVVDRDHAPGDSEPEYEWELTTSAFAVNTEGVLVVRDPGLDRDPPNPGEYNFQVVAREKRGTGRGSKPLSVKVHLLDENDNDPELPVYPTVTIQAGREIRNVLVVKAVDNDAGQNAAVTYSIYHVSNNGKDKFRMDPDTGNLQVVDRVAAGQQFSVTVQARDGGGRTTQTIVEILVSPGPNTGGPNFSTQFYEISVSEGAQPGSTILSLRADDPERESVSYGLVSGNERGDFRLDPRSGSITVARDLDRESLSRYSLVVRAEDPSGLSSTATVNILVLDINDKNPEFQNLPFQFQVVEGKADAFVGTVRARDEDAGENGAVFYSVPRESGFKIDRETGDLYTNRALDYETDRLHLVVVTAEDGGPDPRISTATVTVSVRDVPDEPPFFPQRVYTADVEENRANAEVIRVQAEDPDEVEETVTYKLLSGGDLFSIDPTTGLIRTFKELDYEKEKEHVLVVGTQENTRKEPSASATVIVHVQDANDVPPVFTLLPRPVHLRDTDPIGATVTTVVARDSDGTSPNNKVSYEIVGEGSKTPRYFLIDRDSGTITIKDDLRKEVDAEWRVSPNGWRWSGRQRQKDGGKPELDAVAKVLVYVEKTVTLAPEAGIGFAEAEYQAGVLENPFPDALVKRLSIVNKPDQGTPLDCHIIAGNERGHFYATRSSDGDCEIRVKTSDVDFEWIPKYELEVEIKSLSGYLNQDKKTAKLTVNVLDQNDNEPEFVYPEDPVMSLRGFRYFASIPENAPIGTSVLEVKAPSDEGNPIAKRRFLAAQARDGDTGNFGRLTYSFEPESDPDGYFSVEEATGILRLRRSVMEIPSGTSLPFRLGILVRDGSGKIQPGDGDPSSHEASTLAIVNVIRDENQMVLVIANASPEEVMNRRAQLVGILEEQSSLVIEIEKMEARRYLDEAGKMRVDMKGTDLWFHAIDPKTEVILSRNSTRVQGKLSGKKAESSVLYFVNGNLGLQAVEVREGGLKGTTSGPSSGGVRIQGKTHAPLEGFQVALLALAALIFLLTSIGILYLSCLWSKYQDEKKMGKVSGSLGVPTYEPVHYDPTYLKEYETQVLQMSITPDEGGGGGGSGDFQLDFRNKNHALDLQTVDYISKEGTDGGSGNTTTRASSLSEDGRYLSAHSTFFPDNGVRNPIYNSRDEREQVEEEEKEKRRGRERGGMVRGGRASENNENVIFGHGISSPYVDDSTTEL